MSRGYILVVDDDVLLAELAVAVLQPDGDETRVAHDGREALRVIEKRVPDLVLLDANMPVLDGFGVLVALKADPILRRIPVIMLTALRSEADFARRENLKLRARSQSHVILAICVKELRLRFSAAGKRDTFRLAERRLLVLAGPS